MYPFLFVVMCSPRRYEIHLEVFKLRRALGGELDVAEEACVPLVSTTSEVKDSDRVSYPVKPAIK